MTRRAGKTRDTGAPSGAPNPATGSRVCPTCGRADAIDDSVSPEKWAGYCYYCRAPFTHTISSRVPDGTDARYGDQIGRSEISGRPHPPHATPDRAPARRSTTHAAIDALVRFSEEERLFGAAKAHESFDGILTEHAGALEEIVHVLREGRVSNAIGMLDQEIAYIRALGSVAATEEEEDAK